MDNEKRTILIIDDEANVTATVEVFLKAENFNVFSAMDGNQGIKLAKKINPDLILLDINMPGMDGFQVLKILKKDAHTCAIPVAMFTVRGDEESMIKAMQLYDEDYIEKTIELPELKTKIEKILQRRTLGRKSDPD